MTAALEADDLDLRARDLLGEIGLLAPGATVEVRRLSGGVAADIGAVELGGRVVCVKFALPKLRVAADWRAPVHRNRAEYAWLGFAGATVPGIAPALLGRSDRLHGFAMEFVGGPGVRLWKAALLGGALRDGEAPAVGRALGRIHAASTRPGFDPAPFRNRDDFHALRIEPYLLFTATRHPALAARLGDLADSLFAAEAALVHGDVSPKNILFRGEAPVLLDAECATMGDPCFDLAFCLNHLVLKALHLPALRPRLLAAAGALWEAYAPEVAWEPPAALEARVAALLPALLLARVDGKSPVEYLSPPARDWIRAAAPPLILGPPATLEGLLQRLGAAMPG